MAQKIKAVLTFVKIFPATNERKEESVTIIGDNDGDINVKISPVIDAWVKTDIDSNGTLIYQCYLKSIVRGNINYVPKVDSSAWNTVLDLEEMMKFIVMNKVMLIPTEETWLNDKDQPIGITHIVHIDGKKYEGYTVPEAIHTHINMVKDEVS